MRPITVLALVLVLGQTAAAHAQELNLFQKLELRNACAAELEPLCGDAGAGQGQLAQCVRANLDKLSTGCRQTIEKLRADLASTSP